MALTTFVMSLLEKIVLASVQVPLLRFWLRCATLPSLSSIVLVPLRSLLPGVILLPTLVRLLTFFFQRESLSNNSQALLYRVPFTFLQQAKGGKIRGRRRSRQ